MPIHCNKLIFLLHCQLCSGLARLMLSSCWVLTALCSGRKMSKPTQTNQPIQLEIVSISIHIFDNPLIVGSLTYLFMNLPTICNRNTQIICCSMFSPINVCPSIFYYLLCHRNQLSESADFIQFKYSSCCHFVSMRLVNVVFKVCT